MVMIVDDSYNSCSVSRGSGNSNADNKNIIQRQAIRITWTDNESLQLIPTEYEIV